MNQKGIIAVPLVVGLLILAVVAALSYFFLIKPNQSPDKNTPQENSQPLKYSNQGSSSMLKTEYSNPFDQKSQYKNPFSDSSYQNPFDQLKQ